MWNKVVGYYASLNLAAHVSTLCSEISTHISDETAKAFSCCCLKDFTTSMHFYSWILTSCTQKLQKIIYALIYMSTTLDMLKISVQFSCINVTKGNNLQIGLYNYFENRFIQNKISFVKNILLSLHLSNDFTSYMLYNNYTTLI